MNRSFEYSESLRRQSSQFLFGEIEEVLSGGFYRVRTDDNLLTAPVPQLRPNGEGTIFFSALSVGEQVLIMAPFGDLSLGVIAGSIPRRAVINDRPLSQSEWTFKDGNQITYDHESKEMVIRVKGGKVRVLSEGGEVFISSPKVSIEASAVEIKGNVSVTGNVSASGGITGEGGLTIKGELKASSVTSSGEVKAGGVSLGTHVHSGVSGGQGKTLPPDKA